MNFYDDPNNVSEYLKMCEGYDGSKLYSMLQKHVKAGSSLLELGSGGGLDLEFLSKIYNVTGSDRSDEFLKVCKSKYPEVTFINLDATDMKVGTQFDAIYSNKVLHHLSKPQLIDALAQQAQCLTDQGVVAHSFWIGDENLEMHGMLFTYYQVEKIKAMLSKHFDVIDSYQYTEFEENDSLFIVARLKS